MPAAKKRAEGAAAPQKKLSLGEELAIGQLRAALESRTPSGFLEEARLFDLLTVDLGLARPKVLKALGMSKSYASRLARVSKLPRRFLTHVRAGRLAKSVVLELVEASRGVHRRALELLDAGESFGVVELRRLVREEEAGTAPRAGGTSRALRRARRQAERLREGHPELRALGLRIEGSTAGPRIRGWVDVPATESAIVAIGSAVRRARRSS